MSTDEFIVYWETHKKKLQHVFEIMSDYFGEDRVDLVFPLSDKKMTTLFEEYKDIRDIDLYLKKQQDSTVLNAYTLIHIPETVIRNEFNESHVIKDFFFRIEFSLYSILWKIEALRTTYTIDEYYSQYIHSHVGRLDKKHPKIFGIICTGTSPLSTTITNLKTDPDDDLWMMLCSELEDFAQVESIDGGPFIKMNEIRNPNIITYREQPTYVVCSDYFYKTNIKNFIAYALSQNIFKIGFAGNSFFIAEDPYRLLLKLSDCFIEWYNAGSDKSWSPLKEKILWEANLRYPYVEYVKERDISISSSIYDRNGETVLTFKGRGIPLKIEKTEVSPAQCLLLDISVFGGITNAVLTALNFSYNTKTNEFDKSRIII